MTVTSITTEDARLTPVASCEESRDAPDSGGRDGTGAYVNHRRRLRRLGLPLTPNRCRALVLLERQGERPSTASSIVLDRATDFAMPIRTRSLHILQTHVPVT